MESVLLNYPIPLILLGEVTLSDGNNGFEIIDGMQRLNALFGFIENQFSVNKAFFDIREHSFAKDLSLQGVFKPMALEKYQLLKQKECAKFLEYQLAVTIYRPESPDEI